MTSTKVTKTAGLKRRPAWMALGVLAGLLAIPNAHASSWNAATIDGQGGANGRVFSRMIPWGTVPAGGNSFFVYAIATNTGTIFEGWYASGDWHYIPIYSSASAQALQASAAPGIYVAHVDRDFKVRLTSWSLLTGWSTRVVDGEGQSTFNNLRDVSTVAYGSKLYIFYRESNQPWQGLNALHEAIWDGSSFSYHLVDQTANFAEPTAVAVPDGLHIFYYDEDNATLRGAYSEDGVNIAWTATLDGVGGLSGDYGDVGHHPSAIVFNGAINVFYEDRTGGWLRLAQLYPNGSVNFGGVAPMDSGSYNAPVIHNKAIQVYYTSGGQFSAAWGTVPNSFGWAALDGPGVVGNGVSQDVMYTPVAALEVNNTAPSVFYEDSVNGALRNSYWVP